MKFGLFPLFQALQGERAVEKLDEIIGQVRAARKYGFDSVLIGQHFLSSPYQMLQPMPLLGRLATEAEGLRIGTGIVLLSILNPVAVAEEAASLDVICGGRFILGVGLGYRDVEDEAFGVRRVEKPHRFEEGLEVIKALWTGEPVNFNGRFFQLKNAKISVKPIQKPRPPIWIAANDDKSVTRAARLGDAWLVNPHASLTTLTSQVELYRQVLDHAGKSFPTEFPIIRECYVAASTDEALAQAGPFLEEKYKTYISWGQDKALPKQDPLRRPLAELASDRFIIGSPSNCIDELDRFSRKLGVNHLILRMSWPGMKLSSVMNSISAFGERVIPYFRGK